MYLKVMADAHGGEGNPEITKTLTGKESIKEILNIALALEKQSILFYIGLYTPTLCQDRKLLFLR
jgi:rubrerythrin